MRIDFNPFNVDLKELEVANLGTLKSVAEGWYIEYKSQLPKPKKIAKSLAAFSNHYGGWLFYGIDESKDGSNLADSFPGIKKSEIPKCLEDIRNAARNSINPTPYFEVKVLEGPCSDIGLTDECSVIVVLIPIGNDAPYVHSDGRIYRRVADSSDPRPETDRFVLDNLAQRRLTANESLRSFLQARPITSEGESETSFLHLYLRVDPLKITRKYIELSFERFQQLMSDPTCLGIGISLNFDNIFTMSDGFVARQININDPYNLVLTWRYYLDGSAMVSIPFSSASITDNPYPKLFNFLKDYNEGKNVIEEIGKRHIKAGQLLDINNLFYSVSAVVGQYRKLVSVSKLDGPLYAKAALENIWRRIPFFDTRTYIQYVRENGFPLIQFDEEFAPPGSTFESLRIIKENGNIDPKKPKGFSQIIQAAPLLTDIGFAVGLSHKILFDSEGDWIKAANRALDIGKKRSAQKFDD